MAGGSTKATLNDLRAPVDPRDRQLVEQAQQILERDLQIVERDERIAVLERELDALKQMVMTLKEQFEQSSRNSGRPPSGE